MSGPSLLFVVLAYVAIAVFLFGFLARIWVYARTPAPLKIPLNPSPVTAGGVAPRMLAEVALFKSLFFSNKVIWLAGYVFHIGLLIVLIKHIRFLIPLSVTSTNFFTSALGYITTYEMYAGLIMLGGLALLLLLRLAIDRTRYVSIMSDYILLIILISIASTGLLAKHFFRVDVSQVKEFMMGIISFNPQAMPTEAIFIIHISLVLLLLVYFPFSKLMHSGGIFFSPTRNQVDNPREKRLVAPWAENLPASVPAQATAEETPEAAG
ncbi:MAG: respiratory nitrate reductase subunit gamma [Thermoleophilia bacterium]